tara:strand:- start:426 stop:821 length:396 start_codon:yes stop_codon:yes gene_type:complete
MSKKNNKKQGGQLFQFNLTSIIDLIKNFFTNIIYAIGITIFYIDSVFFILTIISIFVYMFSRINIPMIVFEYFRDLIVSINNLLPYHPPENQSLTPPITPPTTPLTTPPITPPQGLRLRLTPPRFNNDDLV